MTPHAAGQPNVSVSVTKCMRFTSTTRVPSFKRLFVSSFSEVVNSGVNDHSSTRRNVVRM